MLKKGWSGEVSKKNRWKELYEDPILFYPLLINAEKE